MTAVLPSSWHECGTPMTSGPVHVQPMLGDSKPSRFVRPPSYGTRMTTTSEGPWPEIDTLAGPDAPDGVRIRSNLLPPGTHGSNIRAIVDKQTWDRLRIPVAETAQMACEICGSPSTRNGRTLRPDCHEKWVFEFRAGTPVQRLERLIALCPACHQVQHSGLARIQGLEGEVIAHLQRVNGWSRQSAVQDLIRASERCRALDRYEWDLDLSTLAGQLVVEGFASLYIPAAARPELGNSFRKVR